MPSAARVAAIASRACARSSPFSAGASVPVRNGLSAASGTSCDEVVPKMALDGRPAASALASGRLGQPRLADPSWPGHQQVAPGQHGLGELGEHDRAVRHRHHLGGRRAQPWVHDVTVCRGQVAGYVWDY